MTQAWLNFPKVASSATTQQLESFQPVKRAITAQKFERIFIIDLENSAYSKVMQDAYFADLASRGLLLTQFSAVQHPSQPNYIAQIAGDPFVTDDGKYDLAGANLVDLLEGAGVTWKTYQQDYPGNCYTASSAAGGLYARKHNPFMSFDSVRLNAARCAKIVPATQLDSDIAANALPQYSFYVPNQENDAHNTGIAFAANWLQGFLEPKLQNANFMSGTLVVVTFDEDDGSEQNHIYTVLLANTIAPGTDATAYNHYSMLKFVEDNFNLGTLNRNDVSAVPINVPLVPPEPTATPQATISGTPSPTQTPTTTVTTVTPTAIATTTTTATPQAIASGTATPTALATTATPVATASVQPNATATLSTSSGGGSTYVYLPMVYRFTDVQPGFPIRAAFYYPWFPEAWTQSSITPYTNYAPTLGYYDLNQTSTILNHLEAMQYANIQAGIASWWRIGQHTDTHLAQILATTTAHNSPIRWSVYYEKESIGNPTVDEIRADLIYLRDHYGANPSFWRVGGRFVVFVYADGGDGCDMASRWKQANTDINAYIVLKVFPGFQQCADQPALWHQYGPAGYSDQQGQICFAISPGFWQKGQPVRLPRDLNRWKSDIRQMVASGAQLQLITTFNEWGEGTAVESAQEWSSVSGYGQFLDALHNNGN